MGPPDPRQRFEEIYMAHYADLLGYVRRRTECADDAADALSETFTTAWRRVRDIPEGEQARLWLYGVARLVLANQRRGQARRGALAARLREELATWDQGQRPHQDSRAIREAFRRLSPDDRELLSLVSWEGLDTAQIATVLGCSRGAVRLRLHRARKRLARELDAADLDLVAYGPRAVALLKGQS
ncbi:RNA polymerase sigma factor [Sphaerisporangium sp. NPDC005288]|uniref:RNA polymerase sigma factor n=1 Tax=unclassified Sphaerisporangium TaxID=2630420 RepID=UPI0033B306A5